MTVAYGVFAQQCTTRLLVGSGAAAALAAATAGATLVVDHAVADGAARVLGPADCTVARRIVVDGPPHLADVRRFADLLGRDPGRPVLVLGGGSSIDLAKLGLLAASDAGVVPLLQARGRRNGLVDLSDSVGRGCRLAVAPTTIGTGSEVSAVACFVAEDGGRRLVSGSALRPDDAALDPLATDGLPHRLLREGLLEVLLRLVGTEVSAPAALPLATAEALSTAALVGGLLVRAAHRPDDPELRLMAAQLSAATHRGWALVGRPRYASSLWYVANETSTSLGVSKMAATAGLLPAFLGQVLAGNKVWGDRARAQAVWAAATGTHLRSDSAASEVEQALTTWLLPSRLHAAAAAAAPAVAESCARRWGAPRPMLAGVGPQDVEALVRAAAALPARDRLTA